jgi:hypothetical protein
MAQIAIPVVLILAACTKEPGVSLNDEDAIRSIITEDMAEWFNPYAALEDTTVKNDSFGILGLAEDTLPFIRAWGRKVGDKLKKITILVDEDTAYVTVNWYVEGIFHVITPDWEDLEKPLSDTSARYAVFLRTGERTGNRRGWVLDSLSWIEVESESMSVDLDSVRVSCSVLDTVITDPLELWQREEIPLMEPGDEVEITLHVDDFHSTMAFLHHGRNFPGRRRYRFEPDSSGQVLRGTWIVPEAPGVYHAAFDLIHEDSFFTEDHPYDSNTWLLCYRVQ